MPASFEFTRQIEVVEDAPGGLDNAHEAKRRSFWFPGIGGMGLKNRRIPCVPCVFLSSHLSRLPFGLITRHSRPGARPMLPHSFPPGPAYCGLVRNKGKMKGSRRTNGSACYHWGGAWLPPRRSQMTVYRTTDNASDNAGSATEANRKLAAESVEFS